MNGFKQKVNSVVGIHSVRVYIVHVYVVGHRCTCTCTCTCT